MRCEPSGSVVSMPPRASRAVELIEQPGEGRRGEPGGQPAADREAAIRFDQMLAARAHAAAY